MFILESVFVFGFINYANAAPTDRSTGLVSGGEITCTTPSETVSISVGKGYVVDISSPDNPSTTSVTISAQTYNPAVVSGNIAIGVDSSGDIVELGGGWQDSWVRDYIILGSVSVMNNYVVAYHSSPQNVGYSGSQRAYDFMRMVIGPANLSGNDITADPEGNQEIFKSAGQVFMIGTNFHNDPSIPDIKSLSAIENLGTIKTIRHPVVPAIILLQIAPATIPTNKYDDGTGGSGASIPADQFVIQTIYAYTDGIYACALGQETFANMNKAEEAIVNQTMKLVEYPPMGNMVRLAYIIVQEGATDFTDEDKVKFIKANKFRNK